MRAAAAIGAMRSALVAEVERLLGPPEAASFLARLDVHFLDIYEPLDALYGSGHDVDVLVDRLLRLALAAAAERPPDLRELDRRREVDQHWYQRARMVGYV